MRPGVLRLHNPMSAVVWLALFVPGHLLGGSLAFVLPSAALVLGALSLYTRPAPWEARRPAREAAAIFFLLALAEGTSYLYSMAFNGVRTGPLDAWALARPLFAGVFTVYLIRHHDATVRRTLESALLGAIYLTLFLRSIGARSGYLFEPAQSMGYLAALAAIHFLFFSQAPLARAHAAAAAAVVLLSMPPGLASSAPALAQFRRSPLLGWGPASYDTAAAGSQYLSWLVRYGVAGTGLILTGLAIVAFRLLRGAWKDRRRTDRRRLVGSAAFLGFSAGMLMAGAFLEDFRLYALTAFLVAGVHEDPR